MAKILGSKCKLTVNCDVNEWMIRYFDEYIYDLRQKISESISESISKSVNERMHEMISE